MKCTVRGDECTCGQYKHTVHCASFGSVVERSVAERNVAANTFRDRFDGNVVSETGK